MKKQMKESFLIQKRQSNSHKPHDAEKSERTSVASTYNGGKNQLLEGVLRLMRLIIQKEEKIQTLKEMLTSRADFNPEALYFYISRDENQADRRYFCTLLEENHIHASEEEVKLYLNSYGLKERVSYSSFINLIFPVDVDLLKYISVTGIKKYSNQPVLTEEVLCVFLMLLQEEISMLIELDELKTVIMPKITRKEIKTLMRLMKKNGQCHSQMDIESQAFVKYEQLKTLFKNLVEKNVKTAITSAKKGRKPSDVKQDTPTDIYTLLDKGSSCVFRKFSMGNANFINLEDFEFWLRPWSRLRSSLPIEQQCTSFSTVFELSGINEIAYNQSNVSLAENVTAPLSHVCC